MENIINDCKEWAEEIGESFQPDLIVFIAKSGFLFAKPMAEHFDCAMVDIIVSRPASKTKDKLKKIIKLIPKSIILFILKRPFMYKLNDKEKERKITITERYENEKRKKHEKILIVDDSVDTGWTMRHVNKIVKENFPNAIIKISAYVVIDYSAGKVNVDYYRYRNKIILTATSRASNQYETFLGQYVAWVEENNAAEILSD